MTKINKLLLESVDALDSVTTVQNEVVITPSTPIEFQMVHDNSNSFCVVDMRGQAVDSLQMIRDDANIIRIVDKDGQSVDDNLSQQILAMHVPMEPQNHVEKQHPQVSANTRAKKQKTTAAKLN